MPNKLFIFSIFPLFQATSIACLIARSTLLAEVSNLLAIDGYSFTIFVTKDGQKQEAYNSGSLSGGRQEKLLINKKLKDYIDVTGVTQVSLQVTAINTIGGVTNINRTSGEAGKTEITDYEDTIPPKCVKPASPYVEGDWLNKNEYNTTKLERKLTVGCDDGLGSGCIRNYFTMSWPNDDDKLGAEFVYIEVKDNAGNISLHNDDCMFRVNVDIETPEASITAFAGASSNSNTTQSLSNKLNGSSILSKSIISNDSKTSVKINSTDYKNLVSNTTDVKWMNNEQYPNGVIYRIDLKDNLFKDASVEELFKTYGGEADASVATIARKCAGFDEDYKIVGGQASDMLGVIDKVINQISDRVTTLGAAQNRIESAIESIGVQSENITSSLSTLRDADIAEESSNYIQSQILQQAAATLLSTANQTPSIALNLL